MSVLEDLAFWHWWILGVGLLAIEVLAPGASFLWLAIAAGVVGLAVLLAPATPWEIQFILFTVLSLVSVFCWRMYLRRNPTTTDQPALNRRGEQYVGRTFTLSEPLADGRGTIRVDDTTWAVHGADQPVSAKVRVTGVDGTILMVEPGDQSPPALSPLGKT